MSNVGNIVVLKGAMETPPKKAVDFYNGTGAEVLLRGGYAVCYDQDYGTASAVDYTRAHRVLKPATANLKHFAGVLAPEMDGLVVPNGKSQKVEILEASAPGALCEVWTDQSVTLDTTRLYVENGSFALTNKPDSPNNESKCVAVAMQTVDRSSNNGVCQAKLVGLERTEILPDVSAPAESRAATALPTAAIWDNFDLEAMRKDPLNGVLLEVDFKRHGEAPDNTFTDAAESQGISGLGVIGEYAGLGTTDNQGFELQFLGNAITLSGAGKWALEARVKQSVITDARAGYFIGLGTKATLAGDQIADAGTLVDAHCIGFQVKEADGDKIDVVYIETGSSQNEHAADWATQAADAYNTVGLYYNGVTIQMYLDGVAVGTAISAADIAAADFPTGEVCIPSIYEKNAHADDFTVTLDWLRVAQIGS